MRRSWQSGRRSPPWRRWSDSVSGLVARLGGVVPSLLWLTAIVFLVQLLAGARLGGYIDEALALNGPHLLHGWIWQPVTYLFLHAGIWHILWNMLFLWFFGREVELFIGPRPFTVLYLVGGVMGGLLWAVFNFDPGTYLVGASAAVLACVVAFATLFPDREITLLVFFVLPVTLRAKYIAIVAVGIDIAYLLAQAGGNVAHLAHLGGAAVGYLYIKHLGYGRRPRWLAALHNLPGHLVPRTGPRPPAGRRRPASPEDFMREQVDPILDKISRQGMQSLTPEERATLDAARDLMDRPNR
ncbi:rhomboid family intramembrane serine protease [bacterium]|nr:rhomboid family intramembrane serine protease [bacterium]